VLLGLLALARAPVELAEAEVAVGDERAHAELRGDCQRLSICCFGLIGVAARGVLCLSPWAASSPVQRV